MFIFAQNFKMMKEKIIEKSADLFLNLGFKSVTMDDIAQEMGISKKTIYQYFATKTKLVEATAIFKFNCINDAINLCFCAKVNPIEEILKMKDFIISQINSERPSAEYQFKKYYPRIFSILKQKQFEITKDCISGNLKRGIKEGYYREDINIEFISRAFFALMVSLKDEEVFPKDTFTKIELLGYVLDYHLRGISTIKGQEFLNQIKTNN